MNPLIDRYVHDVIRHLPERDREDVKAELVSNIEAMLPENATDADVIRVLESLGSPSKMSEQYRTAKRYLISPAVFDDYLMVLKIVAAVLFSITIIAGLIGAVLQSRSTTVTEFIVSMLKVVGESIFNSAFAAFTWVTIGFAMYEHFGTEHQKKWTVKDLPHIPKQQIRISRTSAAVSMVFSVVFSVAWVVVIYRYANYIAWYEAGVPTVPFFHIDILISLVPYIIALAVLSLLVFAGKIIFGAWNYRLAVLNAVYSFANLAYVAYFLNSAHVFNEAFFAKMADLMKLTTQAVSQGFATGFLVLTALVAIGAFSDTITGFYRAYRNAAK